MYMFMTETISLEVVEHEFSCTSCQWVFSHTIITINRILIHYVFLIYEASRHIQSHKSTNTALDCPCNQWICPSLRGMVYLQRIGYYNVTF